jgi:cytoskeletal protein RodZ
VKNWFAMAASRVASQFFFPDFIEEGIPMRSPKTRPYKIDRCSALLFLLLSAAAAQAGGGFSSPANTITQTDTKTDTSPTGGPTAASETAAIGFSQNGVSFTAVTTATAATTGNAVVAAAGDVTDVQFPANAKVSVDSTSNADSVFEKGGNSLADSKSTTTVTITINGKPYAVATEVAMAMARVTAQGSTSTATATGTLSLAGDGSAAGAPAGPVSAIKPPTR